MPSSSSASAVKRSQSSPYSSITSASSNSSSSNGKYDFGSPRSRRNKNNKAPEATIVDHEDISYNVWQAQRASTLENIEKKVVRGGALKALVYHLDSNDPFFVNAFLATYRSFSSPEELFQLLVKRFKDDPHEISAMAWVGKITNVSYTSKLSGYTFLKNGVGLCQVLNSVEPHTIEINYSTTAAAQKQNIERFLEVCEKDYGMTDLFQVRDLSNGTNMKKVYQVIEDLSIKTCERGYNVPLVKQDPQNDVLSVLHVWISQYDYDFRDSMGSAVHKKLIAFIDSINKSEKEKAANALEQETDFRTSHSLAPLVEVLRQKKKDQKVNRLKLSTYAIRSAEKLTVATFQASSVAEQLTLMEADLMSSLRPFELLGCSWSKSDKHEKSPSVMAMIEHFNDLTLFIGTHIVTAESPETRAVDLVRFIDVCDECVNLGNYSSAKAILGGLQSVPVFRMKQTWAQLSKEKLEVFDKVSTLLAEEENYLQLRNIIETRSPPCIPYLGVFLTDLTMLDAANDSFLRDKLINFEKKRKEYSVIQTVKHYQNHLTEYINSISPHYSFFHWYHNYERLSYDDCYNLSLKREPRDGGEDLRNRCDTTSLLGNKASTSQKLQLFFAKRPKSVKGIETMQSKNHRVLSGTTESIKILTPFSGKQKVNVGYQTTADTVVNTIVEENIKYKEGSFHLVVSNVNGDFEVPFDEAILHFRDISLVDVMTQHNDEELNRLVSQCLYYIVKDTGIVKVNLQVNAQEYRSFVIHFQETAQNVALEALERINIEPSHTAYSLLQTGGTGDVELLPGEFVSKYLHAGNTFTVIDLKQPRDFFESSKPSKSPRRVTLEPLVQSNQSFSRESLTRSYTDSQNKRKIFKKKSKWFGFSKKGSYTPPAMSAPINEGSKIKPSSSMNNLQDHAKSFSPRTHRRTSSEFSKIPASLNDLPTQINQLHTPSSDESVEALSQQQKSLRSVPPPLPPKPAKVPARRVTSEPPMLPPKPSRRAISNPVRSQGRNMAPATPAKGYNISSPQGNSPRLPKALQKKSDETAE